MTTVSVSKNQLGMVPLNKNAVSTFTLKQPKLSFSKKRIGCYSYNLNDCVGSGYSSQVYKGYKNDNKQVTFAIKVIKLATLSKGCYQLLQNQITILKELDHPHIIKMHDIFYTQNNCYIITDFCEGGTLQSHIQSNIHLDWKLVFNQLLQACCYLQKKLIIHRDLKPANIFLKRNQWKIGDFGFARYIPYKTAQIKQIYMIGSPLYMPPETLSRNIYSLKTDSFAFGVLFFHIITKQFPWPANNRKQLLASYSTKKYPIERLVKLTACFQRFLRGLCQIQISQRFYITDFQQLKGMDSGFSQTTQATNIKLHEQDLVSEYSQEINLDMVEKMKLCKFLYYIDSNIQHLPQMKTISQNIRRLLKLFCIIFGWIQNPSFVTYLAQFKCSSYKQLTNLQQLRCLNQQLNTSIDNLEGSQIRRCQILRIKMIQLLNIVNCLLQRDFDNFKLSIQKLVLHADFSKVLISPTQINQIYSLRKVQRDVNTRSCA